MMKRFNARRKLKAAVHTALLISKKSSIFGKLALLLVSVDVFITATLIHEIVMTSV